MADSTTSTIMDVKDLVAAPLIAVVAADSDAALRLGQFIEEYGFVKVDAAAGDDLGKLRMLEFAYDRAGQDGKPVRFVVKVPLLSLIPLPALQVKHAEFEFHLRIVSTTSSDPDASQDSTTMKPSSPVGLKGMLAPRPPSGDGARSSLEANMKVQVRMEQAHMPAGLSKLLTVMSQNVTADPVIEAKK